MLETLRREIRRLSSKVQIQIEDLREMLKQEVLKREVFKGEKSESARKKVRRAASKPLRAKREAGSGSRNNDYSL